MNALRLSCAVLLPLVALAAAADETPYRSRGEHSSHEWRGAPSRYGRVLDLRQLPVVIDEPGSYVLNRDWVVENEQQFAALIEVVADGVSLDLRGFVITGSGYSTVGALIRVSGHRFSVRNGRLGACCEGAVAITSTGEATSVEDVEIYSYEPMQLLGPGASLRNSSMTVRYGIEIGSSALVQNNYIFCQHAKCLVANERNKIIDNRFSLFDGSGVSLTGDRNVVARNIVEETVADQVIATFLVESDYNVLRDNTVIVGDGSRLIFDVKGSANVLDGNIAAPCALERCGVGIRFEADGNFYGDNRMSGTVPFALGATTQVDWGGNVGY